MTQNLSFTVNTKTRAYEMFTWQATTPSWITNAGFTNTNTTGMWHDNTLGAVSFQLFNKCVSAGGSVAFSGATSIDYVVLLKPDTSCP